MADLKKCVVCGSAMELWKGKKWICTNDNCVNVELANLKPWFTELAENAVFCNEQLLNCAPLIIATELSDLRDMLNKGEISGLVLKLKDVFEVILKFPLLPILSMGLNDSGRKNLYREILYSLTCKLPNLGDWYGAALRAIKNDNSMNVTLKKILTDVLKLYDSEKIIRWRNLNIGHGAYTSEEDKDFRANVAEKIQALADHFTRCAEEYVSIKIFLKHKKSYLLLAGVASSKKINRSNCEIYFEYARKKFPLVPFMKNIDNGIYFFDSYLLKKKKTAYLNYADGKKFEDDDKNFDTLYKNLTTTLRIVQTETSAEEKIRGSRSEEALEEILNSRNH